MCWYNGAVFPVNLNDTIHRRRRRYTYFVVCIVTLILVKKMLFQYCFHKITGSHDSVSVLFSFFVTDDINTLSVVTLYLNRKLHFKTHASVAYESTA